ncbi:MAG TPA: outer membrane protein assembly factor BamB, partial [Polaromonas sp.]|nr:outer membrane protein assembly factor BamB [Polaromonas sp.]
MIYKSIRPLALSARAPVAIIFAAILSGCFGGASKLQPAELQPVTALVAARQSWTTRIGQVNFPLEVNVSGNSVAVASSDGTVAVLDAQTGHDVWRVALNMPIAAGVGSDGKVVAVVTKANEVVALQDGHELWRQKL